MTSKTPTSPNNSANQTNGSNAHADDNSNSNSNRTLTMNSIEEEYHKIPDRSGWHRLFQEIREKCEAHEKLYGTNESEKPQNRCLNRYRDVNPYDHSRIVIHRGNVDYINANLVKLERADRKYILTQGPLFDTVGHFWLMVWEQNTKAILMLNKLMEKKQVKCHLYWPNQKGAENALKLDEVKLSIELLQVEEYKNYIRRWFKLTDLESNQSREIMQFHYTTWPDFGIPSSPNAFLQFLKTVRDSGALNPDVGPAVVHCSAGIGRSGTFCLVDCCLVLIDKEGENNVSVKDVLYELRRYRMGLIQTADQLYFSYQAIIEGIKLLKDPVFLEYTEEVCNTNSEVFTEEHEIPPPLPPRTHSLLPLAAGGGGSGALTLNIRGKPLPNIPASESLNELLFQHNNKVQLNDKDALNNFISTEKHATENMSNRPLPPLPKQQQNSLDRVHESESDDSECYEYGIDDDNEALLNDEHNHAGNDNSDAKNAQNAQQYQHDADDVNANNENANKARTITTNKTMDYNEENSGGGGGGGGDGDGDAITNKTNGIDGINNVSSDKSPENELKRRRRYERQSNIEQKVNEIKRKQREAEESKKSAKKRRSLITYIAAGVIVGVICVYAYAKLN